MAGGYGTCGSAALDAARNGQCVNNVVFNISSKSNPAYNSYAADGIYWYVFVVLLVSFFFLFFIRMLISNEFIVMDAKTTLFRTILVFSFRILEFPLLIL
jgi:hypothetical protein